MTLLIQGTEHRDTQAIQAKLDELLHTLSIPLDDDEAEAFLQGRNIKGQRAQM